MNEKLCPQCSKPSLSIEEIGWKRHRVVGESPRGYRFSVLTTKVPTAVLACADCDFEEHGYIYEGVLHLEDTKEEIAV